MKNNNYKRGQLSPEIQNISKEFFGYEITKTDLRLFPYILYIIQNNRYFETIKLNHEEIILLNTWKDKKLINPSFTNGEITTISKKFYDYITQIIWLGYINYDNQGELK